MCWYCLFFDVVFNIIDGIVGWCGFVGISKYIVRLIMVSIKCMWVEYLKFIFRVFNLYVFLFVIFFSWFVDFCDILY